MMKRFILISAFLMAVLSCGDKPGPDNPTPPGPVAPTSITLSASSLEAAQAGETLSLEITAPARPVLSGLPAWVTLKDGTYKDYKITLGLVVAANDSYDPRSVTVNVSSTGVSGTTFTIHQAGKTIVPDPTLPDNEAVAMARKLGFGWNLGNQMEAHNNGVPSETAWTGVPCTQETFNKVAAAGITSVRIPVSWMSFIGPAPDYILDETRLARLKEIVGYAHNAGLVTVFNIHHDGAESQYWLSVLPGADNTAILAEIGAVWTQLANAFRDEGDWLIFESFNEINDGGWGWSTEYQTAAGKKRQNDILNGWNQKFVDVVRATGGNNATRWLGVPGYAASPEYTLDDGFMLPNDPAGRIMVGVHEYTPYDFCQTAKANEWGHNRKTNLGDPTYGEDYMKELFNRLYTKWVANNVPVYLGEFGCANRTSGKPLEFQLYYLEYMSKCARCFGMGGMIWDNGAKGSGNEVYGIFDHGNGSYMDSVNGPKIVAACKKGFTETDPSYTLQSVYDKAPTN